ncbi:MULTISPECIES: two-component system sensor histidine kinase CreC [unclassified Pseudoalteromonas]|uniref:two-component system sensor histidine kinase CreC n=1 Tax=unclassified Pseudoalteromonas TaxID=194690 RepID=UPI003870ADBB
MNPFKQFTIGLSRFKGWPKIPLGFRLFLLYFVLVILTTYLVSSTVMREIKPTVRQVSEETLVDMANLLAVMARDDLANGTLLQSGFVKQVNSYGMRQPNAEIWGVNKPAINHRIYITDSVGVVIIDSWQRDVGKDFSRWNDVYLTLRGEYGARSTALDANDPLSTVMHVAAPIIYNEKIIGTVTVAKANRSVQPFINMSKYRVLSWLAVMSILALIVGALIAWRINGALFKLANYADKMGRGEKASKPTFRIFYEYGLLSEALENMRRQLDGKSYVENYVQTLTHELKSPLSAIKGASEILQTPLSNEKQQLFVNNIESESARMQMLIDKLLALTKLEQLPELEKRQIIVIAPLLEAIRDSFIARITTKNVLVTIQCDSSIQLIGDRFLIQQTLYNIIDNALDFLFDGGQITINVKQYKRTVNIKISNTGPCIPDYALSRITERFYSLPRASGNKSTGLGLNFAEQVVKLHKGQLIVSNSEGGVVVEIIIATP